MIRAAKMLRRYWETVRWLKPTQVYGRIWFRLVRPKPRLGRAPPQRPATGGWILPARRKPSLIGPATFDLLNDIATLDDAGWDDPRRDKLWRYNQHYFDDMNARSAELRGAWHSALVARWIAENPPARGSGWEPYPISLRVVNWIKWALGGGALDASQIESLANQVRYLGRRLEHHLLGNHLFANAKALVFAGLWFDGPEARRWLDIGFRILAAETREQVLPDGGQFERSPMYHALAFEDVLDLIDVCRTYRSALSPAEAELLAHWEALAPRMEAWLAAMSHPDGDLAFFNDTAIGIAPSRGELEAFRGRLGLPDPAPPSDLVQLRDSGFARVERAGAVLICDIGLIGPDYLPGHAHADTLSFELSLFRHRVIVNSGTSLYGASTERLRQRGTAAHSTVIVADQDSSDVWSGFRVGVRARPLDVRISHGGSHVIEATHDGYRRRSGGPLHLRRWTLSDGELVVEDRLTANAPAEARFHLHPDVMVDPIDVASGRLRVGDGRIVTWSSEHAPARLETSTWHPEFGATVPNKCLVLPLVQGRSRLRLMWDK